MVNNILSGLKKIVSRKKNFKELYENTIHSQSLAKMGSWTYDIRNDIVFWTEEIYNFLDCSFNDLNDRLESFLDFVHHDDLEIVKNITESIKNAENIDTQYRVITSEGKLGIFMKKQKFYWMIKTSRLK